MDNLERIDSFRHNPYIRERDLGNGISSFNFSNEVFYNSLFEKQDCKIRGLFLDNKTGEIRMRSFLKFFDIQDSRFDDCQLKYIRENFHDYPIEVCEKSNGYLGLVSSRRLEDGTYELLAASKSSMDNWYAHNLRELFIDTLGDDANLIQEFCEEVWQDNATYVFEVIDPVNDPHIIRYHDRHLVLLDKIFNDWDFRYVDYDSLSEDANYYGFEVKKRVALLRNYDELEDFIFNHKGAMTVEGYVLRSKDGKMWKLHCQPYIYKKSIRSIIERLHSGKSPEEIKNYHERIHNDYIEEYLPNLVHDYEIAHNGDCPKFLDIWTEIAAMI